MHDDTVILASGIRGLSAPGREADAVVLRDDTIIAVGSRADILERYGDARVDDLGGATLSPGFVDAHMHPYALLSLVGNLDLSGLEAGRGDELESLIRAHVGVVRARGDRWVVAMGYDERSGHLDRLRLDAIEPELPVFVWHHSAHLGIFNSRALRELDMDRAEALTGGSIDLAAGFVREASLFPLTRHRIPISTPRRRHEAMRDVSLALAREGVTAVVDAGAQPSHANLYAEGVDSGDWWPHTGYLLTAENIGTEVTHRRGVEFLGYKAFADGSVAARTCVLRDLPPGGGAAHALLDATSVSDLLARTSAEGACLAIHANGDATIELILDVVEAARMRGDRPRVRLEHATFLDHGLIARIAAADIDVVPLTGYLAKLGGRLVEWYGSRLRTAFAFKSLHVAGVRTGASSDAVSGPYAPLMGIDAMVNRRGRDGVAVGPEQAVDLDTALDLYTRGSAAVCNWSSRRGAIGVGMAADLVAFDRDPSSIPLDEISSLRITRTYIGGTLRHAA